MWDGVCQPMRLLVLMWFLVRREYRLFREKTGLPRTHRPLYFLRGASRPKRTPECCHGRYFFLLAVEWSK